MLSLGGAFVNVLVVLWYCIHSNYPGELAVRYPQRSIPTCLQTSEPPTCRGTVTATEPFNSRRNPLQ